MPMIEVKLYDRRVTEESVPKMIEALTQALADTSGADPAHIQVVIQGGFVLSKAKGDRTPLLEALEHLKQYFELLFDKKPRT